MSPTVNEQPPFNSDPIQEGVVYGPYLPLPSSDTYNVNPAKDQLIQHGLAAADALLAKRISTVAFHALEAEHDSAYAVAFNDEVASRTQQSGKSQE